MDCPLDRSAPLRHAISGRARASGYRGARAALAHLGGAARFDPKRLSARKIALKATAAQPFAREGLLNNLVGAAE